MYSYVFCLLLGKHCLVFVNIIFFFFLFWHPHDGICSSSLWHTVRWTHQSISQCHMSHWDMKYSVVLCRALLLWCTRYNTSTLRENRNREQNQQKKKFTCYLTPSHASNSSMCPEDNKSGENYWRVVTRCWSSRGDVGPLGNDISHLVSAALRPQEPENSSNLWAKQAASVWNINLFEYSTRYRYVFFQSVDILARDCPVHHFHFRYWYSQWADLPIAISDRYFLLPSSMSLAAVVDSIHTRFCLHMNKVKILINLEYNSYRNFSRMNSQAAGRLLRRVALNRQCVFVYSSIVVCRHIVYSDMRVL